MRTFTIMIQEHLQQFSTPTWYRARWAGTDHTGTGPTITAAVDALLEGMALAAITKFLAERETDGDVPVQTLGDV